ncbi:homocysteine S-methyltransferase family protein [Qiania dongpingensis]|uniref:Homocysteine S-methyltransferase family protein n=1 Tax=Qiania dongpingensis TaxID=2763669 RepID=A0A7G9G3J9_9FIRM|nr:homocysteine S-methyltransferase family protein [Qiania dongpingensis]QNM05381.1 homocysteine S-methyltransferase family protein [Qiania dongpingensis]
MTRKEFQELVKKGTVLLDGATGSNLMKAGMPRGVCTEQWICGHRGVLVQLQKQYLEAGSQIVYAPTFSANRISLAGHGLEGRLEEINRELVGISREAVGNSCLVAGDVTTTGKTEEEYGVLLDVYREQIQILADAGVDLIVAETMLGLEETMAALDACREVCGLPMICSMTIESDGSLFFGGNVFDTAAALAEMGADAVGINCSVGPDQLEAVVRTIRQTVSVPVLVKPNAGMPVIREDGEAVYSMAAEEYAGHMAKLVEAGAGIVGGCCGTTPEYIKKVAEKIFR